MEEGINEIKGNEGKNEWERRVFILLFFGVKRKRSEREDKEVRKDL